MIDKLTYLIGLFSELPAKERQLYFRFIQPYIQQDADLLSQGIDPGTKHWDALLVEPTEAPQGNVMTTQTHVK